LNENVHLKFFFAILLKVITSGGLKNDCLKQIGELNVIFPVILLILEKALG
jgi:hypothetical protein